MLLKLTLLNKSFLFDAVFQTNFISFSNFHTKAYIFEVKLSFYSLNSFQEK